MYLVLKILIILLFLGSVGLNVYLINMDRAAPNPPLAVPFPEVKQSTQSHSLSLDYKGNTISDSAFESRKANLEEYLVPTTTHEEDDIFFYDSKTDRLFSVLATVATDNISMEMLYDINNDAVYTGRETFTFQAPPSIFNTALYKSDYTSPKQKFGLVAESFGIQKNGYQLVGINERKVHMFYMDTNLHRGSGLPSISEKLPVTEITVLKNHDYVDSFYLIGGEGGGDDWGLHYIPVCFDDTSQELFIVKADGEVKVSQFLKVGWKETGLGNEMTTVEKKQISCLNQAYTSDDLYAQKL